MHSRFPEGLVPLLVDLNSGAATGDSITDWATNALATGLDTPTLRIIAGLAPGTSRYDAEPYFRSVIGELGLTLPETEPLLRAYVAIVAQQIVRAEMTPEEGAGRIHRGVVSPLNHPSDLQRWCLLWEGLDPETHWPLTKRQLDALILQEAQLWANDHSE